MKWLWAPLISSGLLIGIILFSLSGSFSKASNRCTSSSQAIEFAKLKFVETYGKRILEFNPFDAIQDNDTWVVIGTNPFMKTNANAVGGVPIIKLRSTDCEVLMLIHTK